MDIYHAIAEPTRRNIIEILAHNGRLSATDIGHHFSMSPPAISQHLKVLREANLVHVEKEAQRRIYTLNPRGMREIEHWARNMNKVWDERFDALDKVLVKEKRKLDKK